MSNNNGHGARRDTSERLFHNLLASSGHATSGRPPARFCLETSDGYGFVPQQFCPLMILSFGTTSTNLALSIRDKLRAEFGRIPRAVQFLMADSCPPDDLTDAEDFVQMVGGTDGGGTDPNVGREMFLKTYPRLREVLIAKHQQLSQLDALVPCSHSPQKLTEFLILASNGSTSGGSLEPAMTLIHDVARERKVAEVRVSVLMLGADMPRKDSTRSVSRAQSVVICDTAANNVNGLMNDMHDPSHVKFECPGQPSFQMAACNRVTSISLFDQSNGEFHFETTAELLEMVTRKVLFGVFTNAASNTSQRTCDQDRLGETSKLVDVA